MPCTLVLIDTYSHSKPKITRIAELKDQNKMSSYNLAIIFWPTLLQPTQDVLMRNEDRTKFSNMVEFLIDNSDSLFGPELPSCPPPDDEDIYDIVFHPELVVRSAFR